MAESHLTLITGGSRSGKSSHALALAQERIRGGRACFIATARAVDEEMAARIAYHQGLRPKTFYTLEEPLALAQAVARQEGRTDVLVLDCLTLWISNLLEDNRDNNAILAEANQLAKALTTASFPSYIVTDEVGSGIVPMDPLGRRFRDLLGWTNQTIAHAANQIILMVAGHPLHVK